MKHLLLLCRLLLLAGAPAYAQQALYFPPTPAPAGTWATSSPQSLGWCRPQLDSLLNFLGRKGTKSFVEFKDGRVAVEQYYRTFTQDSVWYWASAGKSLTAMLTGLAQQDGTLALPDSVNRLLARGWSAAPAGKERQITLRQLLSMTSGLDDKPPPQPATTKAAPRAVCCTAPMLVRAGPTTRALTASCKPYWPEPAASLSTSTPISG